MEEFASIVLIITCLSSAHASDQNITTSNLTQTVNTQNLLNNEQTTSNKNGSIVFSEGGPNKPTTPNEGREGVIDSDTQNKKTNFSEHAADRPNVNSSSINNGTERTVIPVDEFPEPLQHSLVPRKGVDTNDYLKYSTANSSINKTSTTPLPEIKPKKPTVTVGSDDEPYAPSHFESSKPKTNISNGVSQVPDIEPNYQRSGQDYVVPIVAVILSVPFVAIIISFVYKHGAEWWKHRHYRRMDFLINGMYDT